MQRALLWLLWAGASGYGLYRAIRLAWFPVGLQATTTAVPAGASPAPEVITPTYLTGGVVILIGLLALYAGLAYLLYHAEYTTFRWLAGAHIVVSILGFSLGWLFLPSSLLLLLALLVSIGLSPAAAKA